MAARDELINSFDTILGRQRATEMVENLEQTVQDAASAEVSKIVKRGIIISLVITGITILIESRICGQCAAAYKNRKKKS